MNTKLKLFKKMRIGISPQNRQERTAPIHPQAGLTVRIREEHIREYDHERALEITGHGDFTPSSLED